MILKVYGSSQSICTRRVLLTLVEKNIPYQLKNVDFIVGKEHKSEAFLKLHPFGKIPVLEDDGFFIYESRAVAKYIAKKFAGQGVRLIPDEVDVKAYGMFEQACSIETSYFDGPASSLVFEKSFKKYLGLGEADEVSVATSTAGLDEVFAVYNLILAKQTYLAGNELTLADLFHLPYGNMLKNVGCEELFSKYPNVDRWFSTLEKRDSWIKVNQF